MIKIVTDTMSDLPQKVVDEYDITLIPAYVTISDESLRDRFDISPAEFYQRLIAAREIPSTSQPAVRDFEYLYRRLLDTKPGATIFSIHISAALSGTLESGRQAAALLPDADIRFFDTYSISLGQGLMVRQAALMAREGFPVEVILERLANMRDNVQIYYTLDTLDYLAKGGRIGRAARMMGTLLDMKPILTLEKGALEAYARQRTHERAVETMRNLALEAGRDQRSLQIGVMHSLREDEARQMADELRSELQPEVLLIGEIGPAIGSHVGPGVLGVCWYAPQ